MCGSFITYIYKTKSQISFFLYLYPRPTKLEGGGVYWIHLYLSIVNVPVNEERLFYIGF